MSQASMSEESLAEVNRPLRMIITRYSDLNFVYTNLINALNSIFVEGR